jgi:hypothetical protein
MLQARDGSLQMEVDMGRKKNEGGKKKVLFAGAAAALVGLLAKRKRLDRRSR